MARRSGLVLCSASDIWDLGFQGFGIADLQVQVYVRISGLRAPGGFRFVVLGPGLNVQMLDAIGPPRPRFCKSGAD